MYEKGIFVTPDQQWSGYSPDGLTVDAGTGLCHPVECKCPYLKHYEIDAESISTEPYDEVPARYIPQLQRGMAAASQAEQRDVHRCRFVAYGTDVTHVWTVEFDAGAYKKHEAWGFPVFEFDRNAVVNEFSFREFHAILMSRTISCMFTEVSLRAFPSRLPIHRVPAEAGRQSGEGGM